MQNNPLVSVHMVTFNHEKFIAQAIESVLRQKTDFVFELVIGEDCSTDETRIIVKDYAIKYPTKIKALFHSYNLGFGGTVNSQKTFHACTGKYIAMCEGDDYWTDPYKLQKQIDFLEANSGYAICFHAVNILENETEKPAKLNLSDREETYSILDLSRQNIIHTPSVVFRSGLIEKFPEWVNTTAVGDYVLHLLNAKRGLIKYFPEVMAVYRMHAHGIWSNIQHTVRIERWLKVLDCLLTEEFPLPVGEGLFLQRRKYANEYLHLLLKQGNWDAFLKNLETFSGKDNEIAQKWLFEYYPSYANSLQRQINMIIASPTYKFASKLSGIYKRLFR